MLESTPSVGVGVFENQLVVDVVFEAPLPQKRISLNVGSREISSPSTLYGKAEEAV